MSLLRAAAAVLWGIAAGAAFGWWFHATLTTVAGLTAAGLCLFALAEIISVELPLVRGGGQ